VETNPLLDGMRGLDVAHVWLFLSFKYGDTLYQCTLVCWYSHVGDKPDEETGMWIVKPDFCDNGTPSEAIIHLDCVLRAAHLVAVCGESFVHSNLTLHNSLDKFDSYYVNKYVDHHAFKIAF